MISVIIPTHDRVEHLKRAVDSVLGQTYNNLELIVVDDASVDNTPSYVAEIKDKRVIYMRNNSNRGGAASRNIGILSSKGLYIGFLDDDDEWAQGKLERQLEIFRSNDKVGVVYTGFLVRDVERDKIIGQNKPRYNGSIYKYLLFKNCVGTTSSVLVRADVLRSSDLFDERMPSCQDWDLWISLSRLCEFDYVNEPLTIYSLHKERISTNPSSSLKGRELILEKYRSDIEADVEILASHYIRIGSAFSQIGDNEKGREYILNALRLRPLNIGGIGAYIATFFGKRVQDYLVHRFRHIRYRLFLG